MNGRNDGWIKEGGKGMGEWMGEWVSGWILGRMGGGWMEEMNDV